MRASWTAMQEFLNCQRKYKLSYVDNLSSKPSASDKNLVIGSAFHAGIEAYLKSSNMKQAMKAAAEQIAKDRKTGVKIYDYDQKLWVDDLSFYRMVDDCEHHVIDMLDFYLPQLGKRYIPATREIIGGSKNDLALEVDFVLPTSSEDEITGRIDAIMYDLELDEYVIVDWKTRENFPHDEDAMMDGQLHLYAAVVNKLLKKRLITRVIMWQFRKQLPKPAEIGVKGFPNTGRSGYDTTWDYWCKTLPAGVDPEKYRDEMKPKMKEASNYMRLVEAAVTAKSDELALQNAIDIIDKMKDAITSGKFPAILGSYACSFCDFRRLCMGHMRYGGDPTEVLELYYEDRK